MSHLHVQNSLTVRLCVFMMVSKTMDGTHFRGLCNFTFHIPLGIYCMHSVYCSVRFMTPEVITPRCYGM